jgi:hypothetical protein
MPNKRDLKLDDYNISKFAYRELSNFCLQYPEKKRKIADLHNPLKCQQYSDMPHGIGVGEPTAQAAERAAELSKDCELIEQAAIATDSTMYQYILLSVTEDIPYRYLKALKNIPCYEKGFIKMRRQFFYLLAKKKGMI